MKEKGRIEAEGQEDEWFLYVLWHCFTFIFIENNHRRPLSFGFFVEISAGGRYSRTKLHSKVRNEGDKRCLREKKIPWEGEFRT